MVLEFETAKTVAAFGGLALGVLNLGISLYKDFFRKGNIKVEIEKSEIKWRSEGAYDFLLSLRVLAIGKDVYLKDVWIEHPAKVFGPSNLSSKLHVNKVVKHLSRDVLALDAEQYEVDLKNLFKEAEYIRDLCISEGQRRTLTITDRTSRHLLPVKCDIWTNWWMNWQRAKRWTRFCVKTSHETPYLCLDTGCRRPG